MKPKLYLMMGYPGAGKTTAAKVIQQLTGAVHLSSDEMRVQINDAPNFTAAEHDQLYKQLNQTTEKLLREGHSVIYDANLNRQQHRQEKYDICKRTGATPVLLWVQTQKTLAKQRALDRQQSHLIPNNETAEQLFDRIANLIEEPDASEQATIIDGTKVSPEYLSSLLFNK
ncbi:MAG: ATP-binding protein [Candidatus Saccharimonadales bacterium]